jgi:hypothetical protein
MPTGARTFENARPSTFKTVELPQPPTGLVEPDTTDDERRFLAVETKLAERGLKLGLGRFGPLYGLRVYRVAGPKTHEVSPPTGIDLDVLEEFVKSDPPTLAEALRVREAYSLAAATSGEKPKAPEMTVELRNEGQRIK